MSTLYTIEGTGGSKRRRKRRQAVGHACTLGDSKRVRAAKGYTQELACTGKGPTGWSFVKGTRRRGR